jgi:hypothetical protein
MESDLPLSVPRFKKPNPESTPKPLMDIGTCQTDSSGQVRVEFNCFLASPNSLSKIREGEGVTRFSRADLRSASNNFLLLLIWSVLVWQAKEFRFTLEITELF